MRIGFAIDHSRCIGCHACSIACKEEHGVPLGVYRTWVKYVEKGTFPDVRRHFSVLRCNHCEKAPCVTICPTAALFRRDNGIIDFDNQHCIGCKACMQACPYDALYLDPSSNTAAKCNFCAHRVDQGLKPSCEVVCPEEAILSGDIDDPGSRLSRFLSRETVTVRKPEQGTRPKLYYKDVDEHSIDPGAAARGRGYLWAEEHSGFGVDRFLQATSGNGSARPELWSPDLFDDAEKRARTTYDVVHHRPWGGKVSAYIFTKSIAAGAFLCAVLANAWGRGGGDGFALGAALLSLLFLGITSVLLVADLKRPERFLKILLRPQWRSWLALGAFVLTGYGALLTVAVLLHLTGRPGAVDEVTALLAVMSAVYTGFLFSQAEGRDFWQDPALPVHLLIQAVLAGSATLLIASAPWGPWPAPAETVEFLRWTFGLALVLDLFVVVFGHMGMRHGTEDAAAAAAWMTRGPGARAYRLGALVGGHLVPLALVVISASAGATLPAALLALAGLLVYEHLWILAGQSQPLS